MEHHAFLPLAGTIYARTFHCSALHYAQGRQWQEILVRITTSWPSAAAKESTVLLAVKGNLMNVPTVKSVTSSLNVCAQ